MKKILFASLFSACGALGLSACNNGDYDVNPAVTASGTNPLNTGNGGNGGGGGGGNNPGTAKKGEIRLNVNGTNYTLTIGPNWNTLLGGRGISASMNTSTALVGVLLQMDNYTGPAKYTIVSTGEVRAHWHEQAFATMTDKMYHTSTGVPTGDGEINVTSDANDEMIGTFNFNAYTTTGEKASIVNGSFDVVKL